MAERRIHDILEETFQHPAVILSATLRREGKSEEEIERAVCDYYQLGENSPQRERVKRIVALSAKAEAMRGIDVTAICDEFERWEAQQRD